LDPPFNLGKQYSRARPSMDRLPEEKYLAWIQDILNESVRVLMPGGTLYLYHLPNWAMELGGFLNGRLTFRHWIAISMKNSFLRGRYLYPAHYALLMFTKGEPKHFRRPKLSPSLCRHCGGMVKDYGGYRRIIEQKGLNLSDFWEDLSPVRHRNRKNRVANELPEKLFERLTEMSGVPGMLYVDPFAGSGTGVLVAARAGMVFSACDIVKSNCRIICARLDSYRCLVHKRP